MIERMKKMSVRDQSERRTKLVWGGRMLRSYV